MQRVEHHQVVPFCFHLPGQVDHAGFGDQTITTGQVSGLTEPLVALTENKILGSRPRKPSTGLPPFRPDVPCITQKPPNLQAATGPGETATGIP